MSMPHRSYTRDSVAGSSSQNGRGFSFPPEKVTDPEHDEIIFRRVRGILNKLTVEKFDSLVNQLLEVGIYNENILRGIILLVFEKALDESHYSSMYAQVCLKLSREVPNFEPADLKTGQRAQPPTFLRLLLRKCQDEFENRSQACSLAQAAAAAQADHALDHETSYRRRQVLEAELRTARRKMLGNIKFIGELGKLELLSEKILHKCIQQLVSKVHNPAPEDVECLCQLLKTVGQQLDHERARTYMDQYFDRMAEMSREASLPARVRFMIQDVMDLRDANWIPRVLQEEHGPKTINEIRIDALKEQVSKAPRQKRQAIEQSMRMLAVQAAGGPFGNPIYDPVITRDRGVPALPGEFQGMRRDNGLLPDFPPDDRSSAHNRNSTTTRQNRKSPRQRVGLLGNMPDGEQVSLRPTNRLAPAQATRATREDAPTIRVPPNAQPPALPMQVAKEKPKKKKKPSKEELETASTSLLEEYFSAVDVEEACKCVKELRSPNFMPQLVFKAFNIAIERTEKDRVNLHTLTKALQKEDLLVDDAFEKGVQLVLESISDLIIDVPKVRVYLGQFCGHAVVNDIITMKELKMCFFNGQNCEVFVEILLSLKELLGNEKLLEIFGEIQTDFVNKIMPSSSRTKAAYADLLTKNNLQFLDPMLLVAGKLAEMLDEHVPLDREKQEEGQAQPGVRALAKQIADDFSEETRVDPSFVFVLATTVCRHVLKCTFLAADVRPSAKDDEKALMQDLAPLLIKFVSNNTRAQLLVIYALQTVADEAQFPKGFMLRMSMHLYDLDVVEEDAFMAWRDEINDDYPGKGEALIAINEYLNWMKTAEVEEETDEEDDD